MIRADFHVHTTFCDGQAAPEEMVRAALETLPGKHDFAAFQAAGGTAKTTVRTIHSVELNISGPEWTLTVSGNAFLYNMVRIIVGTLFQIGGGLIPPEEMKAILEAKDRSRAGDTARPEGLTLMEIEYL